MLFLIFCYGVLLPGMEGAPSSVEVGEPMTPKNESINFEAYLRQMHKTEFNMSTAARSNRFDFKARIENWRSSAEGHFATDGQFKSVVFIRKGIFITRRSCTGVVVSKSLVLSSASCIGHPKNKTKLFRVFAGDAKIDVYKSDHPQMRFVKDIYYYPKYGTEKTEKLILHFHNVAVLRIHGSFEFSDLVQPIVISGESPIRREGCVMFGYRYYHVYKDRRCCLRQIYQLEYWSIKCVFMCREIKCKALQDGYKDDDHSCPYLEQKIEEKMEHIGGPLICGGELLGVGSWTRATAASEGSLFICTTTAGSVLDWINGLEDKQGSQSV